MTVQHATPVILAGGLGTRLRGAVPDLPKPLAPVAGRPFLAHQLDLLVRLGFTEAVLSVGYRAAQIRDAFGSRYASLDLRYSEEASALGTGGALALASRQVGAPAVLVLNGDSYCGFDSRRLLSRAQAPRGVATIVVARVKDASRFGAVRLGLQGRVEAFTEKADPRGAAWVSAGVYVLPRRLVEAIPPGPSSLERDAFPIWAAAGCLTAYRTRAPFLDIGTPESYARATSFFEPLP